MSNTKVNQGLVSLYIRTAISTSFWLCPRVHVRYIIDGIKVE